MKQTQAIPGIPLKACPLTSPTEVLIQRNGEVPSKQPPTGPSDAYQGCSRHHVVIPTTVMPNLNITHSASNHARVCEQPKSHSADAVAALAKPGSSGSLAPPPPVFYKAYGVNYGEDGIPLGADGYPLVPIGPVAQDGQPMGGTLPLARSAQDPVVTGYDPQDPMSPENYDDPELLAAIALSLEGMEPAPSASMTTTAASKGDPIKDILQKSPDTPHWPVDPTPIFAEETSPLEGVRITPPEEPPPPEQAATIPPTTTADGTHPASDSNPMHTIRHYMQIGRASCSV